MADLAVVEASTSVSGLPALSDEELLEAMVWQTLVDGMVAPGPQGLAKRMERPEEVDRIKRILNGSEFHVKVFRARRDLVAYTTDRIKELLPRLAKEMLTLAHNSEDSRTQFAALKDLLDRGGTGAAQKLSLSTPSAYQQAIADLIESPSSSTDPAPHEGELCP